MGLTDWLAGVFGHDVWDESLGEKNRSVRMKLSSSTCSTNSVLHISILGNRLYGYIKLHHEKTAINANRQIGALLCAYWILLAERVGSASMDIAKAHLLDPSALKKTLPRPQEGSTALLTTDRCLLGPDAKHRRPGSRGTISCHPRVH